VSAPVQVSVVFATHNRAARLAMLLASLREQTIGTERFEVVVVDDGSADDTDAVLEAELARGGLALRVLRHERARGPAAARNTGWRASRGAFVAFTDDDCTVSPKWLEAGLAAWAEAQDRFVQGRTDPQPAELHTEGPFSRTLRVHSLGPSFQTCNVFYPRSLLEAAGGFDEETFTVPGGEDADLAWRCLERGAEAVFEPRAQAYHAVQDLGPVGKLKVAWRWHETMRLYARHEGMRATLTYGIFWKKTHYLLLRAGLGLLLPRRLRRLRPWFTWPIYLAYGERAMGEGHGKLWSAPYFVIHDAVELAAAVRGAVRYRTLVL
jgi:glycosyltransferase involved in cell wall biosynthesis